MSYVEQLLQIFKENLELTEEGAQKMFQKFGEIPEQDRAWVFMSFLYQPESECFNTDSIGSQSQESYE